MYSTIRPIIFKSLKPEQAHNLILQLMNVIGNMPVAEYLMRAYFKPRHTPRPVTIAGLEFPNIVGLGAGYDKDGVAYRGLATLGFGHIEVGTVTLRPQPGNPQPRVFRLVEDNAIINRMGFPSKGIDFARLQLLKEHPKNIVIGVNIGKNKDTPLAKAYEDYYVLTKNLYQYVDYLTVNVSSPNTPNLRDLQSPDYLEKILKHVNFYKDSQDVKKPIFVKLSPDLDDYDLFNTIDTVIKTGCNGVIISNTTVDRKCLNLQGVHSFINGGLSGMPIRNMTTDLIHKVYSKYGNSLPIIASGGIIFPIDAVEKIQAGASLVQIYTGLIYSGASLCKDILDELYFW